ncbi:MAG: hypothetical protein AAFU86_01080 [Pseudomonadota bacterium]
MVEMIRRAKRSPHENMMHVVRMGLLLMVAMLLFFPSVERALERLLMPDIPITAEIELLLVNGEVRVRYLPSTEWDLDAEWIGQLRDQAGGPIFTKRAPDTHSYGPDAEKTDKPWTWRGWWEDYRLGSDATDPPVPDVPFKICVRYDGVGAMGGKPFNTPYQCSPVFSDHLQEAG